MTSLYIHIPFCQNKCYFCSFVVSVGQESRIDSYLDSLSLEAREYQGTPVKTIYIGGGTPTFMNAAQLVRLLAIIKENFPFNADAEFTIEANPEGIDADKAKLLLDSGINRVSLGVQTLNVRYLKFLGRCHDRDTALDAFALLRKAGFDNVNLDLMYSFPDQTADEIKADVEGITALGSEHLSLYSLTIEPNSKFFVRNVQLPDDGHQAEQYLLVTRLLDAAGFHQYEISNFSKPGKESRHNLNYWTGGNYIGLGIGAHSHKDGRRAWNIPKLTEYISRVKENVPVVDGEEKLSMDERFIETLLFGLRMNRGVDVDELQKRFGCSLAEEKRSRIDTFIAEGFLSRASGYLRPTPKGRLVLDEISARLI